MQEQPVLLQPLIERFGLHRVHEVWMAEIKCPATILPTVAEVLQVLEALENDIHF